jgi:DeoR/GlpR family transcriptional regulator of sugar metabolism
MLPTQRRQAILTEVRQARAVSADDLARRFGVSLETIRRDLRGLRDQGLLERVYGGALSVRSTEGDFATRSTLHAANKLAIAQLAAGLVGPEDTIVIDVGTTALEVARALPASFRGRVLTNSGSSSAAGSSGTATRPASARTPRRSSPSSTPTRRSSAPAASTPEPGSPTTTRPR